MSIENLNVDSVSLGAPKDAIAGTRVLIANDETGDITASVATDVFSGQLGQIAVKSPKGWNFECSSDPTAIAMLLNKADNSQWIYGKQTARRVVEGVRKTLSVIYYQRELSRVNLKEGELVAFDSVGLVNTPEPISDAELMLERVPGVNYARIPFAAMVIVSAQAWMRDSMDQRLILVQTGQDGTTKREWDNFLVTDIGRGTNQTPAFDVAVGDRIFLLAKTAVTLESGLSLTDMKISFMR
jgi:hypothetical protein